MLPTISMHVRLEGLRVVAPACLAAFAVATQAANASVNISSKATQNMSCSGGVCAPTAVNATLNVGDLETMLASGNTTVTTTGSGVQAKSIMVRAPLSWSSSATLTLDAENTITVYKPVSVAGMGGLVLADGGAVNALSFGTGANVAFSNLSSTLSINGTAYTLVDKISTLASAIQSDPSGAFAFAQSYNAKKDGTYTAPPIPTAFTGVFEGLGNSISGLMIKDATDSEVGFFEFIDGGSVHDIGIEKAKVSSSASSVVIGILAAYIYAGSSGAGGSVTGSWTTGSVAATSTTYAQIGGLLGSACNSGPGYPVDTVAGSHSSAKISGGQYNFAGGLVGYSCGNGTVEDSFATGTVSAGDGSYVGGLAGASTGYVEDCFATGSATTGNAANGSPPPSAGGLVGYNFGVSSSPGTITNSYSTGAESGGTGTNVGGMVGLSFDGTISDSYSTGAPTGGSGSYVGGFIGDDDSASLSDTYWDTDTSGITNLSQGAGNIANASGITGLTTAQLQSGLPTGFQKGVWKEKSTINGGLPYLVANPPPK